MFVFLSPFREKDYQNNLANGGGTTGGGQTATGSGGAANFGSTRYVYTGGVLIIPLVLIQLIG